VSRLLQAPREPKDLRPRAAVAAVVATLLFLVLGARLYHLQIVRGAELSAKSRENFVKELVEPAERGYVFDRRGRLLADNRPSFDVYLTPAFCRNPQDVMGRLATHLQLPQEKVDEVLRYVESLRRTKGPKRLERERPYLIKLDIAPASEQRDQLDMVVADLPALDGVDILTSPHRSYPWGDLLAHVVGYLSEVSPSEIEAGKGRYRRGDFIGRRGLERTLESQLRGKDGRRRVAVDAKGHELDSELAAELIAPKDRRVPSTPGNNVELSIDLALQMLADRALAQTARAGALVAVDVHTGFVLAMVSLPSYDPNLMTGRISRRQLKQLVEDPLEPLFQRAVQNHYHPGSTFKIVTALTGLERGAVTPESGTSCGGGYNLGPRRWRCWNDKGHGGVSLHRALVQSCDTYFYWIADKVGLEPIADMAQRLGFGKPTGIELQPEAPGLVPTPAFHVKQDKGYYKGYALNAAIGQGAVNVTALQLAMAYAAIGNGGTLYKPHLVRRVERADGEVVRQTMPEEVRQLDVGAAHMNAVLDGLRGVVQEPGGTAYSKRLVDVPVAGKTGTAQVVAIGEKREKLSEMSWEERDHAWFAALAPADDPEIAVVAVNEHGGHGGAAAAPAVMAVVEGYFDLKRREAEEHAPLSADAIRELQPAPRFAAEAWAARQRERAAEEAEAVDGAPPPAEPDESVSSPAEVADPQPVRRAPARAEGSGPRADEEPRAPPQE